MEREGPQLGLERYNINITWKGRRGATLHNIQESLLEYLRASPYGPPHAILFHVGTNDLIDSSTLDFYQMLSGLLEFCRATIPQVNLIWSYILPRPYYFGASRQAGMNQKRQSINRNARSLFWRQGGRSIEFSNIDARNFSHFRFDCIHLSAIDLNIFLNTVKDALEYFYFFPYAIRFPHIAN